MLTTSFILTTSLNWFSINVFVAGQSKSSSVVFPHSEKVASVLSVFIVWWNLGGESSPKSKKGVKKSSGLVSLIQNVSMKSVLQQFLSKDGNCIGGILFSSSLYCFCLFFVCTLRWCNVLALFNSQSVHFFDRWSVLCFFFFPVCFL